MINVTNVTTGYAENAVLRSVSCHIEVQKITVLVGPNGSGKSTLLKTLCGFLPAWSGTVELDGKPVAAYTNRARAQKIAYLAQRHTVPDSTVRRLVLHGRFPYTHFPRHYTAADEAVAQDALCAMHLEALADKRMQELSGGQQQKAYLAMALAQVAPLLVLDEPLTFLDIRQQLDLLQTLKDLRAQGKTIVLVVHDLNTALSCADTVLVMSAGQVVAQGNPAVIAGDGTIDRVFGVRTHTVDAGQGGHLYTFSTDGASLSPQTEIV